MSRTTQSVSLRAAIAGSGRRGFNERVAELADALVGVESSLAGSTNYQAIQVRVLSRPFDLPCRIPGLLSGRSGMESNKRRNSILKRVVR